MYVLGLLVLFLGPGVVTAGSPIDCNFDSGLCAGYTQASDDDFNWMRIQGGTPSFNTGPTADHTTGHGYYMYTEATSRASGERAVLVSPTLTWSQSQACVTFWYSMWGESMGSLSLEVSPSRGASSTVWSRSGNQGPDWHQASVTVDITSAVQLKFVGTIGGRTFGDIAIDDVSARPCGGTAHTVVPSTLWPHSQTPTLTTLLLKTTASSTGNCDFETNDLCSWWNVGGGDQLDWSLHHTSPTSHLHSGPSTDHTTLTAAGHYIYVSTSGAVGSQTNLSAMLVSPVFPGGAVPGCLRFWFTLYGPSSPSLTISLVDQNTLMRVARWSVDGDYRGSWHQAALPLFYLKPFMLVILGQVTRPDSSVIAIDDISFTDGNCAYTPKESRVSSATSIAFHLPQLSSAPSSRLTRTSHSTTAAIQRAVDPGLFSSCDLESPCGYNSYGDFHWTPNQRSTSTSGTGPSGDHTPGLRGLGHYMYLEASSHAGQMSSLSSEEFPASHTDVCLQFYYYMFGDDMGTLNIKLMSPVTPPTLQGAALWSQSGDHSSQWNLAQVNINASLLSQPFKVVFEGTVASSGNTWLGDMAVDDILTVPMSCPINGPVTTTSATTITATPTTTTTTPTTTTTTPTTTTTTPTTTTTTPTTTTTTPTTTTTTPTTTTTTPTTTTTTPTTTTTTPTTTTTTPTTTTPTTTTTTTTAPTTTTTTPTTTTTTPTTTTTTPMTTTTTPTTTTTTPTTTTTTPTTTTTTPTTTTTTPSTTTTTPTTTTTTPMTTTTTTTSTTPTTSPTMPSASPNASTVGVEVGGSSTGRPSSSSSSSSSPPAGTGSSPTSLPTTDGVLVGSGTKEATQGSNDAVIPAAVGGTAAFVLITVVAAVVVIVCRRRRLRPILDDSIVSPAYANDLYEKVDLHMLNEKPETTDTARNASHGEEVDLHTASKSPGMNARHVHPPTEKKLLNPRTV